MDWTTDNRFKTTGALNAEEPRRRKFRDRTEPTLDKPPCATPDAAPNDFQSAYLPDPTDGRFTEGYNGQPLQPASTLNSPSVAPERLSVRILEYRDIVAENQTKFKLSGLGFPINKPTLTQFMWNDLVLAAERFVETWVRKPQKGLDRTLATCVLILRDQVRSAPATPEVPSPEQWNTLVRRATEAVMDWACPVRKVESEMGICDASFPYSNTPHERKTNCINWRPINGDK